jgi:hypothetical protein
MDLTKIAGLLATAASMTDKVVAVTKLIEAGTELAHVVRANVEEAAATMTETDAAALRARAADLALTNRALSEQVDDLLR